MTGAVLGLFGTVDGRNSEIKNVGLVKPKVTGGNNYVGSLVGFHESGTISHCYVSEGSSTGGSDSRVGGLVGVQDGLFGVQDGSSTISHCYVSKGNSQGGEYTSIAGGLVGLQDGNSTISHCYVSEGKSAVGFLAQVGGLVGKQESGTISACYVWKGTVQGGVRSDIGSLVGVQKGNLIASYAGGQDYKNIVGKIDGGTVKNSYYQKKQVNRKLNTDATKPAKTKAALRKPTDYTGIYADWDDLDGNGTPDTKTYWNFGSAAQYPVLEVDFNNDGNTSDDVTNQRN